MKPRISVVITVDYGATNRETVERLREVLASLAVQECREVAEFILVESGSRRLITPADFEKILPELKIVYDESDQARNLKKRGIAESPVDLVALLDGDCVPAKGWLRACLDSRERCPDASCISGRTLYPESGAFYRIMTIISRSYLDAEVPGKTRHLTENNAVVSARAYLAHAGDGRTPHASSLVSQSMLRAGENLTYDPAIVVTHAFNWAIEREIRPSLGYGMVRTRQVDRSLPFAWTVRMGPLSLPAVLSGRILNSWWLCLKNGRRYGLAWYHQPLAFGLSAICCLMELPAAARALRGDPPPETAFR